MEKLIVMADYMCGIFCPPGVGTSPEFIGASEDLCARFHSWLVRYKEHDDAPAGFDRQAYVDEGRALAHEIQQLLAGRYLVSYRYLLPADNPSAECEWAEEILK